MFSIITLSITIIKLHFDVLSVAIKSIMLNVVMLSVMAPSMELRGIHETFYDHLTIKISFYYLISKKV